MAVHELNAILVRKTLLNPALAVFRVVADGWELPAFKAGQFANIGLPGTAKRAAGTGDDKKPIDNRDDIIRRSYSVASSPDEKGYYEFFVNLVSGGTFSPRLFALEPGDRLWVMPKIAGIFTLDSVPAAAHVVFVATGTGIGPYVSILRSVLHAGGARKFALLHGVRHSSDLGYQSEFETMQRLSGGTLSYLPIVSRGREEPAPWPGRAGHVQSIWSGGEIERAWGFGPAPEHTHVFLCGSPGMIDDMTALLGEQGYRKNTRSDPQGQLHIESYW